MRSGVTINGNEAAPQADEATKKASASQKSGQAPLNIMHFLFW
ncbi:MULTISPECIES: hypothetical protein [Bacillaceae]|nr:MULTISPECIES: hypothetical protein [unclassified Bacillus (in: firmicutes)]